MDVIDLKWMRENREHLRRPFEELTSFPKIEPNQVFISHVGDGEYTFNVFGSVHTNMEVFLNKVLSYYSYYNIKREELIILCEGNEYLVIHPHNNSFSVIARLTLATINPETFPIESEM